LEAHPEDQAYAADISIQTLCCCCVLPLSMCTTALGA